MQLLTMEIHILLRRRIPAKSHLTHLIGRYYLLRVIPAQQDLQVQQVQQGRPALRVLMVQPDQPDRQVQQVQQEVPPDSERQPLQQAQ
jgi:hypothetical protein